jgi:hypothetical protein
MFQFGSWPRSLVVCVGWATQVGRLSPEYLGHSDQLFGFVQEPIVTVILEKLVKNCRKDPVWLRMSHKLIESVPFKYAEHVLVAVFQHAIRQVTQLSSS